MAVDFPQRIAFEDGQFLQASDLEEDQLYHIQRRWQHNLALHSWGVLAGLKLSIEAPANDVQGKVIVHRGMALDGFGRELIVTDAIQKRTSLDPSASYDVWLHYNIEPPIDDDIDDPCDAGMIPRPVRLKEQPSVVVKRTTQRQSGSTARPDGVRPDDIPYAPERPMRFDRNDIWPVFLGLIEKVDGKWTVNYRERRYGGLIAERVEFPPKATPDVPAAEGNGEPEADFGRTMVLNGGDPRFPDLRFAVVGASRVDSPDDLPNADEDDQTRAGDNWTPIAVRDLTSFVPPPVAGADGDEQAPAEDDQRRTTEIRFQAERVVAECDVVMRRGAGLQFERSVVSDVEPTPPTRGWGVYRCFHPAANADPNFADVLQISMPGGARIQDRVAIGATDAGGKFVPILVVRNDETVDVFGPLRVHGAIFGNRSDLPTADYLATEENLTEAILKLIDPSDPKGNLLTIATSVIQAIPTPILGKGLEEALPKEIKEVEVITGLAKQIVERIGSKDEYAKDFAAKLSDVDAAFKKRFVNAIQAVSADLITAIIETADLLDVATAVGNVADHRERALYVALAEQLAILIGGDATASGDFAKSAVDVTDAERRRFLVALLRHVVSDLPGLLSELDDEDELDLYLALAVQLVNIVGGGVGAPVEFADNAKADANPVAFEEFLKALWPKILSTVDAGDLSEAVNALAPEATQRRFFKDFIKNLNPATSQERLVESACAEATAAAASATSKSKAVLDLMVDDHLAALVASMSSSQKVALKAAL